MGDIHSLKLRKIIAISIIALFIGVATTPLINANVVDSELIEITTEFYGMDGKSNSVILTKQEADELESILTIILEELYKAETKEEVCYQLNELFLNLRDYSLIKPIDSLRIQHMITRTQYVKDGIKSSEMSSFDSDQFNNIFALTIGDFNWYSTEDRNVPWLFSFLLGYIGGPHNSIFDMNIFHLLSGCFYVYSMLKPFRLLNTIKFDKMANLYDTHLSLLSIGLLGIKKVEDYQPNNEYINLYGFTGLKVYYPDNDKCYLFGISMVIEHGEKSYDL